VIRFPSRAECGMGCGLRLSCEAWGRCLLGHGHSSQYFKEGSSKLNPVLQLMQLYLWFTLSESMTMLWFDRLTIASICTPGLRGGSAGLVYSLFGRFIMIVAKRFCILDTKREYFKTGAVMLSASWYSAAATPAQ
jgi:hypothetical protein